MDSSIQRKTVLEHQRMATVNHVFGLLWPLYIEPLIFHLADTLAPDYAGGMWTFYTLTTANDGIGFYAAPDIDADFNVMYVGNEWEGTLSADALGITCCLTAYSQLSFSKQMALGSLTAQHYHRLRAFMLGHPEAQAFPGRWPKAALGCTLGASRVLSGAPGLRSRVAGRCWRIRDPWDCGGTDVTSENPRNPDIP